MLWAKQLRIEYPGAYYPVTARLVVEKPWKS